MRILLASSLGGMGHLEPLVAVGHCVRSVGHEVLVLVPPSLAEAVERTGLSPVVGDQPAPAVVEELWDRVRRGPPDAVRGLIDRELFAERATAAMLRAARDVCASWRPDLVVREPCEYASAAAASEGGISQVQVGISLSAIEWEVRAMVAPIIERHRADLADTIRAGPYLTRFPASLDPSPWPDTRRYRQPAADARPLPEWWPGDDRPLVYVTFGSVTGHLPEAAGVYRTALDAVSEIPARVLLTIGRGIAADALGAVPDNTHVEQWVAQADVFAEADVVVCHGGSGTTFGALTAGLPLVVCPLFADQLSNGRLMDAAGCGVLVADQAGTAGALRALGPADVVPLRAAIRQVLDDSRYRRAAGRMAREIATMPTLADVLVTVGVT